MRVIAPVVSVDNQHPSSPFPCTNSQRFPLRYKNFVTYCNVPHLNRYGNCITPLRLPDREREVEEIPGGCRRRTIQQLHHFIAVQERCVGAEGFQFASRRRAKSAVEPLGERDVEALLLSIDDFIGYQTANGFLEEILCPSGAEFCLSGNAEREFDKLMVEKGHPGFKADAHTHFVDAHQQQLRQAEVQV